MSVLVSAGWMGSAGGAERPLYSVLGALEADEVGVVVREQLGGPVARVGARTQVFPLMDWRWRASARTTRRQAHFHASQERLRRKHFGSVGWQLARAGQMLGDAVRSAIRRAPERDRLRARLTLYLKGPVLVEARLASVKAGQ